MDKKQIRFMTLSGALCALVFVLTAYLHVPVHTGYAHMGDGLIYVAACILPLPYGIFVGGVGALLADALTGYAIWAPGSLIIKSLTVLVFSRKCEKILSVRNLLALIPAWMLCVGGYYVYEGAITGNFIAPAAGIVGNLIQCAFSTVLFAVIATVLDRLKIKNKL